MSVLPLLEQAYCLPWGLIALWAAWELWRQSAAWRALHAMPKAPSAPVSETPHTSEDRGGEDNIGEDEAACFAGVDVLQPIRSGDATLGEALAASLRTLGGRGAHLHWLIDADDREAIAIAQAVLAAQPALKSRVGISLHPPCPESINPKLFKLDRALGECRGEVVLVLDDDAHLPAATIDALLFALESRTTDTADPVVATALPVYLPAHGLGARLLARFVNDNAAMTYLPPRLRGRTPTLNGMCWAMRREQLRRIGGFAPWLRHLTDDLAMAQAVLAAGGRIEQRSEPVWMRTALPGFSAYLRQMHRWMLFGFLLLRSQPWPSRLRIVFENGMPMLLPFLTALALILAPSWTGGALLALGAIVHVLGRARLHRAYTGTTMAKTEPLLSLLVALLLPLHALHAAVDRRIRWRMHRYRVYANDRFEECG